MPYVYFETYAPIVLGPETDIDRFSLRFWHHFFLSIANTQVQIVQREVKCVLFACRIRLAISANLIHARSPKL